MSTIGWLTQAALTPAPFQTTPCLQMRAELYVLTTRAATLSLWPGQPYATRAHLSGHGNAYDLHRSAQAAETLAGRLVHVAPADSLLR